MTNLPIALKSRRTSHWFLGLGALILVAGIVAVLIVVFTRSGSEGLSKARLHIKKPGVEKTIPVSKQARNAVKIFLQTAVPRRNLAAAWPVAGPQIRQGMSRAQFLSGNIAVVPEFRPILKATFKTEYSHPKDALIQVGLILGGPKKKIQVALYNATLVKIGTHWLVNDWQLFQVYTPQANQ